MTTATATPTAACNCELAAYTITGIPVIERVNIACTVHGLALPAAPAAFTHRGIDCTPAAAGTWTLAGNEAANRSYRKVIGLKADGLTIEGDAEAARRQIDSVLDQDVPRPALRDCKGWIWNEEKQRNYRCNTTLSRYSKSDYCSNCQAR